MSLQEETGTWADKTFSNVNDFDREERHVKETRKQALLEAAEICENKSRGLQASFKDGCRDCAEEIRKKAEEL